MFGKLVRKDPSAETATPAAPAPVATQAWDEKFQAAQGNDEALLALAKEAPALESKLAAVLALSGEEALRQAEREFRAHDRRVHSAAKQRYEALVRQRRMRAQADELIGAAAALAGEAAIPANRLVELDHAWQAVETDLLEDAQRQRFVQARAALAELVRERGERQRSVTLWSAEARRALETMEVCRADVAIAAAPDRARAAAAGDAVRAALVALPAAVAADGTAAALARSLQAALDEAALIAARLELLDEFQRGEDAAGDAGAAVERWRALAPIADKRIAHALDARFDKWQRSRDEARKKLEADARPPVDEKAKAERQARSRQWREAAQAAEQALAAGQLAEAGKLLTTLQAAQGADKALQAQIERLQAEMARLKGWQRWGGGRARDDLVDEAEALARSAAGGGERPAKLPLGQLEKSIDQLRTRWKELDRLGGATSKTLWQRFDNALKTAHQPIAAHAERLKQARRENLAAREKLLDALDAVAIGGGEASQAPDWKAVARALTDFQAEWRKLGPVEHAVPHKAQAALQQRMKASVARIEEPLREARRGAQAEREQFVARARALAETAHERDTMDKIRELQAAWQRHAKAQPLLRKVENALWTDFKAAIDGVLKQREQAYRARQAGLESNRSARQAIIARVEAIAADTPPAEIKRALAAAEAEWRQAGEAPKDRAAQLETRFRRARDGALRHVADGAKRAWHATCDALASKLALCDELETTATVADAESRWNALPALPSAWEEALRARFIAGIGGEKTAAAGTALDDVLLRLEAALGMPSPEPFQAARRTLKLLAMKNALEERQVATPAAAEVKTLTAKAFGHAGATAEQRERLAAIVAALRAAPPAGLTPPSR